MSTAASQERWLWNSPRKCSECETMITGKGTTGMCGPCARLSTSNVPTARCSMPTCKALIPVNEPRYQYVLVTCGGRTGRLNKRQVVATICDGCWKGKAQEQKGRLAMSSPRRLTNDRT